MKPKPATSNEHRGHEQRDANLRGVLLAGASVTALVVLALILVRWIVDSLTEKEPQPEPPPAVLVGGRRTPTGPLLQSNPGKDLQSFRASEEQRLHQSGRDPMTLNIHIPIERAMRLVVDRGLPTRSAGHATSRPLNESATRAAP